MEMRWVSKLRQKNQKKRESFNKKLTPAIDDILSKIDEIEVLRENTEKVVEMNNPERACDIQPPGKV